jgi:hypothetical protein
MKILPVGTIIRKYIIFCSKFLYNNKLIKLKLHKLQIGNSNLPFQNSICWYSLERVQVLAVKLQVEVNCDQVQIPRMSKKSIFYMTMNY